MAPVWIPPVTVKLEPSAAIPSTVFDRAETGARPFRAAMLVALCASAAAAPIIKAKSPIPHPSLVIAPLLPNCPAVPRFYRVIETIHEPAGTGSPGAGLRARLLARALLSAE